MLNLWDSWKKYTEILTLPLMSAMDSLSRNPQRFPFFKEPYIPQNKYHKMFVEKWYLILYQVQDDIVYVEYILDCRREYGWLVHWLHFYEQHFS